MTDETIAELREKCRKEQEAGWQTCASVRIDTLLELLDELEELRGDRAAVVAWLRRRALVQPNVRSALLMGASADEIERGEHRREKKA